MTLVALAQQLGADPEKLAQSIRGRNASLPVSCFAMGTDAGLAINERFQILRADKQPIPGLFGAGTVALGGLMAEGHGHHLGWAFTSGRLAGRNAAHLANTADAAPKK